MGIEFEETIHIQPEISGGGGTPIDAYTKEETDALLDIRIEPIEEVIPSDASSSNKLVTASDIDGFSNKGLSNLDTNGNNRLHALKCYEDNGELLTDAEGLADIKNYVRSTFDLDKFTITGSPTITDDGIISGYSTSNIAQADCQIGYLYNKSWTVSTEFEYSTLTASTPLFAFASEISYGGVGVSTGNGIVFQSRFGESTTEVTAIRFTSFLSNATIGNRYRVTLNFNINTGLYTLSYEGLDDNLSDTGTYTPTTTNKQIRNIYLQNTGLIKAAGGVGWTGNALSIDLKKFTIIVDGVEVFNGNQTGTDTYTIGGNTVTIPYTLSKTGSKIVDSQYRNEVKAVYEQFGCAPYYTLSDVDFTLPQGEVYGMIEKGLSAKQNALTAGSGINIQTVTPGQLTNSYVGYNYSGGSQTSTPISNPTSVTLASNGDYGFISASFVEGVDTTRSLEIECKLHLKDVNRSSGASFYIGAYNNNGAFGDYDLMHHGYIRIDKTYQSATLAFKYSGGPYTIGTFILSDPALTLNSDIYVKITKTDGPAPTFTVYCKELETDEYTLIGSVTYSSSFLFPLSTNEKIYICWSGYYATESNSIDLTHNSVVYTPAQEPYLEISTQNVVGSTSVLHLESMTSTEYGSRTPDSSTLYILTDTGAIYLGTTLIAQKNT